MKAMTSGLWIGPSLAIDGITTSGQGGGAAANAMSKLATKLANNQPATMYVNGDSTAYSEYGTYYLFGKALGDKYDATVNLYRWAEWDGSAPTGPKAYATVTNIRTGAGPTLTIYLAALPGEVAACMSDTSRKPAAMDAIPTPDIAILDHGHNMQNFSIPFAGEYCSGRGMYFSAVGALLNQWPGISIVLCTQNPWRDSNAYQQVYDSQNGMASQLPTMTVVDTYQGFIARNKDPILYRATDVTGVHPSDEVTNNAGAQLKANIFMSAFAGTKAGVTVSTVDWTSLVGTNLISNGGLTDWTAALPTGYSLVNFALATKDFVNVERGAPWSASVIPNTPTGNQNSCFRRGLTTPERAVVAGKVVSVIVRIPKANSTQRRPYATFGAKNTAGVLTNYVLADYITKGSTATFDGSWWLCASGITVGAAAATDANTGVNVFPAFGVGAPPSNDPISVGSIIIVEGYLPMGGLPDPTPDPGDVLMTDDDGAFLTDDDGTFLEELT